MKERVVIHPDFRVAGAAGGFALFPWWTVRGTVVARSRSSETVAVGPEEGPGRPLHLKRYRYSIRQAIRGALRNTFLGPSRVAREFHILARVRGIAGEDFVPPPLAFGERRSLGFLREAFLATETVGGARPLTDRDDLPPGTARGLGDFLGRFHRAGYTHGRLYARNLLLLPGGGFRLVDLDRARHHPRGVPEDLAAVDLACLFVSTPALTARRRVRAVGAWLGLRRSRERIERMLARVESAWDVAERGLTRRRRPR